MYATIQLENGKTVNTNEIKCPICGRKMEIENYHTEIQNQSIYIDKMQWPFQGQIVRKETTYITFFKCPERCVLFSLKHIVKSITF